MGNRRKPTRPSSLRAALAAQTSLRTYHDIAIVPGEQVAKAQRAVEAARQLQVATMLSDKDEVRDRGQQALDKAETELRACFHRIYFRGLPIEDFDALVDMHPPTPEQAKEGKAWNDDTFIYALLAECVEEEDGTPGGLTAEEWEAELTAKKWAAPEVRRVKHMAYAAQRQTMADAVPKG